MRPFARHVNFYYTALSIADSLGLLGNAARLAMGLAAPKDTRWSRAFEAEFGEALGGAIAYTFPSARSALYATLKALGVGRSDEILITGFTCVAVPNPVIYLGARPVYVDIHPRTFNMDAGQLSRMITPRTRAVIVQHTFGNPAGVEKVVAVARKHGLAVVEDCALALGSRCDGRPVGTTGDAAVVSFELSKTLSAGWGGMAWTRDGNLGHRLGVIQREFGFMTRLEGARRSLQVALSFLLYHPRVFAVGRYVAAALYRAGMFRVSTRIEEEYGEIPPGFFLRLPDAHWKAVRRQFAFLETIVTQSRTAATAYERVLSAQGVRTFPEVEEGTHPAWVRYPFLVADRRDMRRFFRRRGIEVGEWFDSPVSGAADLERIGYRQGDCPVAEFVSQHIVNLPVLGLLATDVERIGRFLKEYLVPRPENRELAEVVNQSALTGFPLRTQSLPG